jgi:hypothetical protein
VTQCGPFGDGASLRGGSWPGSRTCRVALHCSGAAKVTDRRRHSREGQRLPAIFSRGDTMSDVCLPMLAPRRRQWAARRWKPRSTDALPPSLPSRLWASSAWEDVAKALGGGAPSELAQHVDTQQELLPPALALQGLLVPPLAHEQHVQRRRHEVQNPEQLVAANVIHCERLRQGHWSDRVRLWAGGAAALKQKVPPTRPAGAAARHAPSSSALWLSNSQEQKVAETQYRCWIAVNRLIFRKDGRKQQQRTQQNNE